LALNLYFYPLFPTTCSEYKRNWPGLQAVFSGKTAAKNAKLWHFSAKIAILKQMFDISLTSLRKIKNTP
jgi:hypothetical protein